ncbi:MAG TPA: TetR/AcrR family transcriptional regulator [Sphingomonas sp.]|uniref:TetR/AcrR family transcriptional regulator n=1 Tax=Sphingomonas sp. TaxID=28214 RepID=UPI002ED862C0
MTRGAVRVGRPSPAQAAQIETRILAAAWDVLLDRGLEDFTIDQVAALAQASKRTIYGRFASRAALFRGMIEMRTTAFIESLRPETEGGSLADSLADQAMQVLAFVRSPEGRALSQLEERALRCHDDGEKPVRRSVHERAIAIVSDMLRKACGPDLMPVDAISHAATFWVASLIGYGRIIGGDPDRIVDDAAWARRHTALFLRGILPGPAEIHPAES